MTRRQQNPRVLDGRPRQDHHIRMLCVCHTSLVNVAQAFGPAPGIDDQSRHAGMGSELDTGRDRRRLVQDERIGYARIGQPASHQPS